MDDRELLIAYLQERDVACPSCYYNLKGNTTAACPECGSVLAIKNNIVKLALQRDVQRARPGDWRHRVAVTGLTVPAAFFALLALASVMVMSEEQNTRTNLANSMASAYFWVPIFAGLVVYLIAAILLNNLKPQFQRRDDRFQRAAMLFCWHWVPVLIALTAASLL